MLIAFDENDNKIYADDAKDYQKFYCPVCYSPVRLRKGSIKIRHFSHINKLDCETSEPESYLHLKGKKNLFFQLSKIFLETKIEYYLPSIKQRPDIYCDRFIIEYQCSPIKNQMLSSRVDGYRKLNIKNLWILGINYYKKNNVRNSTLKFLKFNYNYGFYLLFYDASNSTFIMQYHINQDDLYYYFTEKTFKDFQEFLFYVNYRNQFIENKKTKNVLQVSEVIIRELKNKNDYWLKLNDFCYRNHKVLLGTPLICHDFNHIIPILGKYKLEFCILTISTIEEYAKVSYEFLYDRIKKSLLQYFFMPMVNLNILLHEVLQNFLFLLEESKFIEIKEAEIILTKCFYWYDDYFEKLMIYK